MEKVDAQVMEFIERTMLKPDVTRAAVRRAVALIKQRTRTQPDARAAFERELVKVERERQRLVEAIATGDGKLDAIVAAVAQRGKRCEELRSEIARLKSSPILAQLSDKRLESQIAERAKHWRAVRPGDTALARKAVAALLEGPLWFVPERDGYRLSGATRVGQLLFGSEGKERPVSKWCREGESNPHTIAGAGF